MAKKTPVNAADGAESGPEAVTLQDENSHPNTQDEVSHEAKSTAADVSVSVASAEDQQSVDAVIAVSDELESLEDRLQSTAADFDIKTSSRAPIGERAPRPPMTMQQKVKIAQRGRNEGEKNLKRRVQRAAVVDRTVTLRHNTLIGIFFRVFSLYDDCVDTVQQRGETAVGHAAFKLIITSLSEPVAKLRSDVLADLRSAEELWERSKTSIPADDLIYPQYHEPYEQKITIKTPQALHLAKTCEAIDSLLVVFDQLTWNEMRSTDEVGEDWMRLRKRLLSNLALCKRSISAVRKGWQTKMGLAPERTRSTEEAVPGKELSRRRVPDAYEPAAEPAGQSDPVAIAA